MKYRLFHFEKNYQEIFKCFTDQVLNRGYSQIYSDLGFAEWSSTPGMTYILLAEFTQTTEDGTHVELWGIEGGDPYSDPGPYWEVVDACGA